MTASVTALGLLPIALGASLPGQEIEGPMAIVILGGLCSSTALTLLVLPSLAASTLLATNSASAKPGSLFANNCGGSAAMAKHADAIQVAINAVVRMVFFG